MTEHRIVLRVDRSQLPEHTDHDFKEWIKYQVGQLGGIPLTNPLRDAEFVARVLEIS